MSLRIYVLMMKPPIFPPRLPKGASTSTNGSATAGILFSHPKDFTPVCTTELGYMAGLQPEFAKRNCKIIGLSVDLVSSQGKWAADIEETQGHSVNYR
jgi:alkyl hydroperoxide reductase subunit AhpC